MGRVDELPRDTQFSVNSSHRSRGGKLPENLKTG
jgi:hypothetical protein